MQHDVTTVCFLGGVPSKLHCIAVQINLLHNIFALDNICRSVSVIAFSCVMIF
jgi:hypothetical protein